jgi:hypothetical protein
VTRGELLLYLDTVAREGGDTTGAPFGDAMRCDLEDRGLRADEDEVLDTLAAWWHGAYCAWLSHLQCPGDDPLEIHEPMVGDWESLRRLMRDSRAEDARGIWRAMCEGWDWYVTDYQHRRGAL